jgi:hypothetical protein
MVKPFPSFADLAEQAELLEELAEGGYAAVFVRPAAAALGVVVRRLLGQLV